MSYYSRRINDLIKYYNILNCRIFYLNEKVEENILILISLSYAMNTGKLSKSQYCVFERRYNNALDKLKGFQVELNDAKITLMEILERIVKEKNKK